jgi:thiol-disulfide isomerase/thioredoxin
MAEIVYRLKENIQSLTSRTYDDMAGVPDTDSAHGVYADYDVDAVTGRRVVLFFHANWCPACRAQDQELARWYTSQEFPLSTYKVDYDTEAILKARYGVVYQHTFVLIDASGRAVRSITGPTDAELIALLMSE